MSDGSRVLFRRHLQAELAHRSPRKMLPNMVFREGNYGGGQCHVETVIGRRSINFAGLIRRNVARTAISNERQKSTGETPDGMKSARHSD